MLEYLQQKDADTPNVVHTPASGVNDDKDVWQIENLYDETTIENWTSQDTEGPNEDEQQKVSRVRTSIQRYHQIILIEDGARDIMLKASPFDMSKES